MIAIMRRRSKGRPTLKTSTKSRCTRLLERGGLSQTEIARRLGISRGSVWFLKRGLEALEAARLTPVREEDLVDCEDLPEPVAPASRATKAEPGTDEKIDVMRRRAVAGERIFHPDDAP